MTYNLGRIGSDLDRSRPLIGAHPRLPVNPFETYDERPVSVNGFLLISIA